MKAPPVGSRIYDLCSRSPAQSQCSRSPLPSDLGQVLVPTLPYTTPPPTPHPRPTYSPAYIQTYSHHYPHPSPATPHLPPHCPTLHRRRWDVGDSSAPPPRSQLPAALQPNSSTVAVPIARICNTIAFKRVCFQFSYSSCEKPSKDSIKSMDTQ